MPDRVPPAEVKERARILREMSRAGNLAFRRKFIGQVLPGITLAEEEQRGASAVLTDNYIHVRIDAHSIPANRLVRVRVNAVSSGETRASFLVI